MQMCPCAVSHLNKIRNSQCFVYYWQPLLILKLDHLYLTVDEGRLLFPFSLLGFIEFWKQKLIISVNKINQLLFYLLWALVATKVT